MTAPYTAQSEITLPPETMKTLYNCIYFKDNPTNGAKYRGAGKRTK